MQKRGHILNKSAQVTIFIIIAIVIVALGILLFLFYPRITGFFQEIDPEQFIQTCMSSEIQKNLDLISRQGGVTEPSNYILYQNDKVEYLCYTNEYYKLCVMQEPLLQSSVQNGLARALTPRSKECFSQLKQNLEQRGYSVQMREGDVLVEFLPERIRIDMNTAVTLSKESTSTIQGFQITKRSGHYDLFAIATSILNWEARYGDAESTIYMAYYPNIKVEKFLLSEGSTVYTITHRDTGDRFRFASRSLVLPPGYGSAFVR
jgi:hypothetical protein